MNKFIILLIFLLHIPICYARSLYKLPTGKRVQVSGVTYQGYTFEEMKILLKIDIDLEFYETVQLPKTKQQLDELKKIIEAKDTIIKSKEIQLDLANKDRIRLTDKWSEENKLRHECENKPRFGSWVAWIITAATSTAAITLGIVLIVREAR